MDEKFVEAKNLIGEVKPEISKRIVGQEEIIDGILIAMLCDGHILLEGVPGLAKTLIVKTFAEISSLDFKRIQFTPDLLPADLSGTLIYNQNLGEFSVRKGPVFTNIVLADEINRSPAKVQSALLEAMAEKQVTIGEKTHSLPSPFMVLATQNPIEQEGTYNLPEAELDRFLLKLLVSYPSPQEEIKIVRTEGKAAEIPVKRILTAQKICEMQKILGEITCDEKLIEYIVRIVDATRPRAKNTERHGLKKDDFSKYISFGSSPRAGIAILKCAKVKALFEGRNFVLPEDIKAVAHPVLRHRIVLSYEALSDTVTSDDLIEKILEFLPLP